MIAASYDQVNFEAGLLFAAQMIGFGSPIFTSVTSFSRVELITGRAIK